MTTERDVYEVDASEAVKAFEDVAEAADHAEHAQKNLTEQVNELGEKFAQKLLSVEAYIEAFKELIEFGKESVEVAIEQERADLRLDAALRIAGDSTLAYSNKLREQAESIEHVTGASTQHTMQIQAMLAQMKVAPEAIEGMTDAAYRLAQATGQDATFAARLLARANAEGKEELKKFAISVDDATFQARGFAAVIEEVQKRTISLNESVGEGEKAVNTLTASWENFHKAIGKVIIDSDTFHAKSAGVARDLQMWADILNGTWGKKHSLFISDEDVERAKSAGQKMADAVNLMWKAQHYNPVKVTFGEVEFDVDQKKLDAQQKKYEEQVNAFIQNIAKLRKKETDRAMKEVNESDAIDRGDSLDKLENFYKKAAQQKKDQDAYDRENAEEANKSLDEIAEKHHQSELEKEKEHQKKLKEIREDALNTLKNYGEQSLSFAAGLLKEALLSDTKYNHALHELQVTREIDAAKELGQDKTRVEIEKQLADESVAAMEKRVAEFLANLAEQAAIKAIMEGVEAIASAADYDEPAAILHGVAAAGFAGVAIAAGGTAFALNSSRGMTTDERNNLEQANAEQAARNKREAKQAAQGGMSEVGTSVTVIYMGIAGTTELEQAKELERIRMLYAKSKTGGITG